MPESKLHLIGYASGIAGVELSCGQGPVAIQNSPFLQKAGEKLALHWEAIIYPQDASLRKDLAVKEVCSTLAQHVTHLISQKKFFTVIGGDHTSAIGTWSGAFAACHAKGPLGLIWIDAHMDSHTPETTETGRIHGMPLATLLGQGYSTLTMLAGGQPKLKPEHVCLIAIRSYEQGEKDLLDRLNVRVFYMEEVKERGLAAVFKEALERVTQGTVGYGISLDLDSIDPAEAPGVDVPAADGLAAQDVVRALTGLAHDPHLLGVEIVEFDPSRDVENRTEKLIVALLLSLAGKNNVELMG